VVIKWPTWVVWGHKGPSKASLHLKRTSVPLPPNRQLNYYIRRPRRRPTVGFSTSRSQCARTRSAAARMASRTCGPMSLIRCMRLCRSAISVSEADCRPLAFPSSRLLRNVAANVLFALPVQNVGVLWDRPVVVAGSSG
jgi:hypothetical protein